LAVIALVFALTGGAYAASGALTGKQKKEVEKIAKKFAGKNGAAGATGPAGSPGAPGKDGTSGAAGKNGESVKLAAATACGVPGGTKLTVGAESKEVCNGEDGETGFTDTLPSGKTETGAWAWGPVPKEITEAKMAVSLPIPMAAGTELSFHFVTEEEAEENPPAACPGAVSEPLAIPGNVCMYEAFGTGAFTSIGVFNPETLEAGKLGSTGGILTFFEVVEKKQGRGTWAATAP
jgi:hypothetical protein